MLSDATATLMRCVSGIAIGALVCIPLGIVLGIWRAADRAVGPFLDFARSLPAIALFPVFFRIFGPGEIGTVSLVAFSTGLVLVVATATAVRQGGEARRRAAWLMGASRLDIYRYVILPEATPGIIGGVRIAWSMAVIVVSVVEMLFAASDGLGIAVLTNYYSREIPELWVAIISLGSLGYCGNLILAAVEHKFGLWQGR